MRGEPSSDLKQMKGSAGHNKRRSEPLKRCITIVTKFTTNVRVPIDGWDQGKWCSKMGRLCSSDMEEHLPEPSRLVKAVPNQLGAEAPEKGVR